MSNKVIELFQNEQTFEYNCGSITIKTIKKELLVSDSIFLLEMVKYELMQMLDKYHEEN